VFLDRLTYALGLVAGLVFLHFANTDLDVAVGVFVVVGSLAGQLGAKLLGEVASIAKDVEKMSKP
jgi:hypothetical protein